jgi:phosphocarrier protein HPr
MSANCEQGITLSGDLHARPAGALAVAAGRFTSAVSVSAGGQTADAKSVLGVMGLGATSGQHVTVSAAGPDAREAVAALIEILSEATKVGGLPSRAGRPGEIARAPSFVRENQFFIPNGFWRVPGRRPAPSWRLLPL